MNGIFHTVLISFQFQHSVQYFNSYLLHHLTSNWHYLMAQRLRDFLLKSFPDFKGSVSASSVGEGQDQGHGHGQVPHTSAATDLSFDTAEYIDESEDQEDESSTQLPTMQTDFSVL